jgi:hypothetical protein
VVHHVLYFADPIGRAHEKPQQGAEPGFSGMRAGGARLPLGGWAVGAQPQFFPEGLALQLPKGSDLVVQYHFHPKDEMGSITLIGVPHEEAQLGVLQGDIARRRNELVRERMKADPALARKVAQLLSE